MARKIIPISDVSVHPLNVRLVRTGENITRLAESIRRRGMEYPLKVIQDRRNPEKYLCYDGGYRLEAAREAGLKEVWIEVENVADETSLIIRSFDSADKSVPLNPMEEARAFKVLLNKLKDMEKVGEAVGRDWGYVKERLTLLNLVKKAQALVLLGKMTWLPAYNLSKHPKHIQGKVIEAIEKEKYPNFSHRHIQGVIESLNEPRRESIEPKGSPPTDLDWVCPKCGARYQTYCHGTKHSFERMEA